MDQKRIKKKQEQDTSIKNKLTNLFELPKDVVLNLPLITIVGNKEIQIENYKGIVEYSEEMIKVKTTVGVIKVNGKKLFVKLITSENIQITGFIKSFEYMT